MSSLSSHTVHVAIVQTGDPVVRGRLDSYRRLMDATETAREARLLRGRDRDRFAITRGLVRTLLSRHVDVAPTRWRFVANAYGRPEIANLPAGALPLRFNVSHTPGIVACAVSVARDVGLDVEDVQRRLRHDVAGRYFAAQEVHDLRALPPDRQPAAFFEYWTLKEAYIKARGMGLALPIRHFAFALSTGAPTVTFDETIVDDPASWQFAQAWATPTHRLALAVRRTGADVSVRWEACVPGAGA